MTRLFTQTQFNEIWHNAVQGFFNFEGLNLPYGKRVLAWSNIAQVLIEFEVVFEWVNSDHVMEFYTKLMESDTTDGSIVNRLDIAHDRDLFWTALNGGGGMLTIKRTGRLFGDIFPFF